MNTLPGYVIVAAAIFLVLAAFAFWRRRGSKQVPLIVSVIGAAVVWTVLLAAMSFSGDIARFQTFGLVGLGCALGLPGLYIAMHVYRT
jgi:hypothetical protein